jgi:hypothetical protein
VFRVGVLWFAGLTAAFTAWPTRGPSHSAVVVPLVVGGAAIAGFVAVEGRTRYPMLPLRLFRWRPFNAVNATTFLVYAALSGIFFFLVVTLQVVCGYSPLAAGIAPLPVTLLLLVAGVGAQLTDPATLGPAHRTAMLVCAGLMAVDALPAFAAVPRSMAEVRPPTRPPDA